MIVLNTGNISLKNCKNYKQTRAHALVCLFDLEISQGLCNITCMLTLVLLNRICPAFANSVDPGQLASEEAN